jgi:hypothetical protein
MLQFATRTLSTGSTHPIQPSERLNRGTIRERRWAWRRQSLRCARGGVTAGSPRTSRSDSGCGRHCSLAAILQALGTSEGAQLASCETLPIHPQDLLRRDGGDPRVLRLGEAGDDLRDLLDY